MGIEPTRPAWKAGILPLNYTRMDALFRVSFEIIAYMICFVKTDFYGFLLFEKSVFDILKT